MRKNIRPFVFLFITSLLATAATAQTKPATKKPAPPKVKLAQVNIYFETGMGILTDRHKQQIDSIVAFIDSLNVEKFRFEKILINAHTDDVGDSVANIKLSEKRADAMVEYLMENQIDSHKVVFKYYGENQPITSNQMEEGRALNRRVEMIVKYSIKPKVAKKVVAIVDNCSTDTIIEFANGVLVTINRCAAQFFQVTPWEEEKYANASVRTIDEKLRCLMLEDVYSVDTWDDTCFKSQYTIKIPIKTDADPKSFLVYLYSARGWKTFPKAKLTKIKKKNYIQYKAKCGLDIAIGYLPKKTYKVQFKTTGGLSIVDIDILYRDKAIYGIYGGHLRPAGNTFSTQLPEPFCDLQISCTAIDQNKDTLYLKFTSLTELKASFYKGYLPTGEKLEKKLFGLIPLKERKLYKTYYLKREDFKVVKKR